MFLHFALLIFFLGPNYKELGKLQLRELFPDVEGHLIDTVFVRDCESDMAAAIKKVGARVN